MKQSFILLIINVFLMGCQPASAPLPPTAVPEPATFLHTYTSTDALILNPERGFFLPHKLPGPSDFDSFRDQGYTLVHLNIHLNEWRETDIPQDVLAGLETNFADMRRASIKGIIRFSYTQDSSPDASKPQILRHIEQLTPLLQDNADVIAWMEAGFIGAWGEWHASMNGLDTFENKREILFALLKALPETRMIQVRSPSDIIQMFPVPADAVKMRVAHHNDCFLSSDTDFGTYELDGKKTIERDQAYLAELTRFTPMSGETCAPNPPRSQCEVALQEMALLHFSAINELYNPEVLGSWEEGSCMEEIKRRLGYRLSLESATFNERVRPGGVIHLTINLQNTGFASMINRRPLYVILEGQRNHALYKAELNVDPRTWEPGKSSFTARLHVPSNIAEGSYQIALWLPDEDQGISANPAYAIRFSNENIWDETTGFNVLGNIIVIKGIIGSYQEGEEFRPIETITSTGTRN